ncbi:MAG: divergent polysaccharide deacetylase family protein [Acidobacteriia bacterium]|nr:divergent polysaccharide deacetylase family protein [Terriglobia bacterium]
MMTNRKRIHLLVILTLLLGSCQQIPRPKENRGALFHAELKQALRGGDLAACKPTVATEPAGTDGGIQEMTHMKIVAPNRIVLQQAGAAVEKIASRYELSYKRWVSPKDGTDFVLYEVSEGKNRVSSILLTLESQTEPRRTATLPPDEIEPSKIDLPKFFQGDYRVSIIIDDLGADLSVAEELVKLPQNLTFSIIPELKYTQKTAELAKSNGKEIMVHLPMEPEAHEGLVIEPKTILSSMSPSEVESIFQEMVANVPFAVGMNNHMGSKATPNRALMAEVLALAKLRGLYFIDSRTTPATQGYAVAREMGVPTNFRSVFLDDKRNVPYTEYQLDVLLKRMLKQGSAIAIGHPYPSTIEALRRKLPEFERRGVKIVFASELVS